MGQNADEINSFQKQYFNQLTQTKERIFYILEYIQDCEAWNWRINIFLALTSNASIGAWAVWQELKLIWAIIIALSQVITAIKPLLRSEKRLKFLYPLRRELELIYLDMEKNWYDVSSGNLTEQEIHESTCEFRRKIEEASYGNLKNNSLTENNRFIKKAKSKNEVYFENNFY